MPLGHRRIPALPERLAVHPLDSRISRSYETGRQAFSRACQGKEMVLTITGEAPLPAAVQARIMTTLQAADGVTWQPIPFARLDERTLECRATPVRPGLHSFRAEFSIDNGEAWLRDTVPDAGVLVDPPQVEALRVYTLIPSVSGTLTDWRADLKRIREMGFNAVHLLPITTLDTSESPYAAGDLFSVDPSYLDPSRSEDGLTQLEEFIEEAKSLDIKLIFDLVLNHVGLHSRMATRAPDWIVPDQNQPDGLKRAGYVSDQGWRIWSDLVLINYEHPSEIVRREIRSYMTEYALFWAKYASDSGGLVRFDNLHSSDPAFIPSLADAVHAQYPEVAFIAEYFTDDHTLLNTVPDWGLNLLLATPWNYKFAPQLREYLKYAHRVSGHVRFFMPITSHDSGSPAQEFGTADSTIPRYVAAALLGTGATGIPQGVEYGEEQRIDFVGKPAKQVFPSVARFAEFISRVNAILAEYPAFSSGRNCRFVDGDHPAVIAAFRRERRLSGQGFLVVCNFDTQNSQRIAIDLSPLLGATGSFACHELLSDIRSNLTCPRIALDLAPCAAQVLKISPEKLQAESRSIGALGFAAA
jgi:hypothetical protein